MFARLLEYVPLVAFLIAYWVADLMAATVAIVVATVITLAITWFREKRLPPMPLITAGIVVVFGGLTIALNDDTFIKMKPTIVQALFALVLIFSLILKKPGLKIVLGHAWQLTTEGWHKLTARFAIFFLAMAVLNEIVWRTQSTDVWVNFKVFGIMALTFLFILSQVPFINRHQSIPPQES